jgi:hypothetical protein
MERSVVGMSCITEKYFEDFIPYNLPELFKGFTKFSKIWRNMPPMNGPQIISSNSRKHTDFKCQLKGKKLIP